MFIMSLILRKGKYFKSSTQDASCIVEYKLNFAIGQSQYVYYLREIKIIKRIKSFCATVFRAT